MKRQPEHQILSSLNIALGVLFLFLFLFLIPWKMPLINLAFILLGALCTAGGAGLLFGRPCAATVLKTTAWAAIGLGGLLTLLCLTSMSYLSGVYGRMGKTAAGIFIFLILFLDLILILLPGLEIFHLRNPEKKSDI